MMPVYVITIPAHRRRMQILLQRDWEGIVPIEWPGFDCQAMNARHDERTWVYSKCPDPDWMMGSFVSHRHLAVHRSFLEGPCVVLEDDAVWAPGAWAKINAIKIRPETHVVQLCQTGGDFVWNTGYILTQSGASRLKTVLAKRWTHIDLQFRAAADCGSLAIQYVPEVLVWAADREKPL